MKTISKILFIIIAFICSSCSIATDLFVQNFTSQNVIIHVIYSNPVDSEKGDKIRYKSGILDPKTFRKSENFEFLQMNLVDKNTISLEVPPNSTVKIDANSNTRYFTEIRYFKINNRKLSIREFCDLAVRKNAHRIFEFKDTIGTTANSW